MKTSRYVYSLLTLVLLLACLRFAVSAGAARPAEDRDPQWTYTPIRLAAYTFDPLDVAAQPPVAPELRLSDAARDAEGYYLLQFQGPIQQEWVDTVVRSGVALYDYVPEFTFIAKLDDAARKRVERLPFVRWLGVYQPAFRVQPDLAVAAGVSDIRSISSYGDTGASLHRQIDGGNIALLIRVFPDEDADAVSEAIRNLGGVVHEVQQTAWRGTIRADLPMDQLTAIAQMHGVQWIEPAPRWELTNNVAADVMHVREIWDGLGFRGEGQTVAVTDTGLDQGAMAPGVLHDDFEDGNGNSRVVALFDLVGDGAEDVNNGHGTHVAGSVLGNGIRSGSDPFHHVYPGTAFPGMAPEANLVFQAIEDNETGLLTGLPSDLYPLFAQTYDVGARVHSNSWGAALDGQYTSGDQDVDEFVWDHPNMVVLYAAGNAGEDADGDGHVDPTSIDTPGAAKNAITVGASENLRPSGSVPTLTIDYAWGQAWPQDFPVNPLAADHVSDNPFGMAAFSGRGPTQDGRTKPDIVAPGTNIISTRSSLAAGSGWGVVDGDYMFMGGTSMATPLVAGASALVREFYTRTYAWDPSAALVKATLVNGAQELSPGQYGRPLSQWQRQTVDTWDNVGEHSSLALDSNDQPHISYAYRESFLPNGLMYAWPISPSGWFTELVDATSIYIGDHNSLALDSADHPHISYAADEIKYAWHDGARWYSETVGSGDMFTSIALDADDHPHMTFVDIADDSLKYARKLGDTWSISVIDEISYWAYNSLAIDASGNPHVSYYDDDVNDLKYAWSDNGGTTWNITTVDSANSVGEYNSLALDSSGRPRISYHAGAPYYDLRYAWFDGANWYTETVDSQWMVGQDTSLALDSLDRPRIAYHDVTRRDLKYAWHDGQTWRIESVARLGMVGEFASLELDAFDNPHISYYDSTSYWRDLRYVRYGVGEEDDPGEIPTRPNSVEGWGRLNLSNTLSRTTELPLTFVDQVTGIGTAQVETYTVNVVDTGQPLRVTLAWSDYPGSPAAAGGLVNDLDLVVVAPDGSSLHPTNASQRGASQHLAYDDGAPEAAFRESSDGLGYTVRFTPLTYPVEVDSVQFALVATAAPSPHFLVRVMDDDGGAGMPGSVLLQQHVTPVADGWFTVGLDGLAITSGDFYVELYFLDGDGENPGLYMDTTAPTGRSYFFDGAVWHPLSTLGADANWCIRAVVRAQNTPTAADRVNNLVGVDILTPGLGTYTVAVQGYNVPHGPQPYALVMSGPVLPACVSPAAVWVVGPVAADIGVTVPFTATVTPLAASTPITFTWEATEQTTVVHQVDDLSDATIFSWPTGGSKTLTVTAANSCATVSKVHTIDVGGVSWQFELFLPLMVRSDQG